MFRMFSDLSAFRHDTLGFFESHYNQAQTPLVKLNLGPSPVYLVADPDLIKPIFKATEADIDKGRLIYKLREVIGLNSLTMSGQAHRERRAAIHQHMAKGIATSYVPEISAMIREFIIKASKDKCFDAHAITAPIALRAICDVIFGRGTLTSQDIAALLNAVELVEDDVADKIFRAIPDWPWIALRKKKKLAAGRAIMGHVIDKASRKSTRSSLIQSLQDLGLRGEALRDEILLIIMAGHHTTGSVAAWLLYHIGLDADLAARLAKEAQCICDDEGEIIPEKLNKQASLSRTVANEALRLYPSSYWMSREVLRPIELGNTHLKSGTSLIICPWAMQRSSQHYNVPETFRTDRSYVSKSFIPFGLGPRACVGMGLAMLELQIIALEFASNFEFTSVSPVPAPNPKPSVTLVPPRLMLSVKLRDHKSQTQNAA
jgi:cytochrome P450